MCNMHIYFYLGSICLILNISKSLWLCLQQLPICSSGLLPGPMFSPITSALQDAWHDYSLRYVESLGECQMRGKVSHFTGHQDVCLKAHPIYIQRNHQSSFVYVMKSSCKARSNSAWVLRNYWETSKIICIRIPTLKCFSSHLAIAFAQSVEARCSSTSTSEWSTTLLPNKLWLKLDVWW